MGSCFRVTSSQHDSHPFQTTVKIKVAQHHVVLTNLTMLEQKKPKLEQKKPNIVFEQATSSSFVQLMSTALVSRAVGVLTSVM
jgi:hypothetical protein